MSLNDEPTDDIAELLDEIDVLLRQLYPPEIIQLKLDLLLWDEYGPDW